MSTYPPVYPPFYPTADPPPPPVAEQLLVNGEDLGSYCYMTTDVSSLFTVPARRGDDAVVPGRHGRIKTPGKKFDYGEIVLPMWVVGARPDGTIPSGGEEREFYRRRDDLLRLFYDDEVELTWRRPDSVTLTAGVEVVDVMDFTRRFAEPLAKVAIALKVADPFWVEADDVSQVITSVSTPTPHSLTAFMGATAPIADTRITFYGPVNNPRVAIGSRWVQFNGVIASGRELLLECGHWRASSGAGALWAPPVTQVYREPGPAWLELPPSTAPHELVFTHTGGGSATVEIAGQRKFLTA